MYNKHIIHIHVRIHIHIHIHMYIYIYVEVLRCLMFFSVNCAFIQRREKNMVYQDGDITMHLVKKTTGDQFGPLPMPFSTHFSSATAQWCHGCGDLPMASRDSCRLRLLEVNSSENLCFRENRIMSEYW